MPIDSVSGDTTALARDRLIAAIDANLPAVADALAAIQLGRSGRPLNLPGAMAAARLAGVSPGTLLVSVLGRRRLLHALAAALEERRVPTGWFQSRFGLDTQDFDRSLDFLSRAMQFRCRILIDGERRGSGILIGPTLVLTAWHVVAHGAPDDPDPFHDHIGVELADGRTRLAASLIPALASPWCVGEDRPDLVATDADLAARHDIAVLRLAQPATGFGIAELATADLEPDPAGLGDVVLVHYPATEDRGWGRGPMRLLPGIRNRLGHGATTLPGSSGGGVFDLAGQLIGIHNARDGWAPGEGRFVPVRLFRAPLLEAITRDLAPARMWSLDGTPDGPLVIGRQTLFGGFAAARRPAARIRGVWSLRGNPDAAASGIGFTFRIVEALAARDTAVRLCRISFERAMGADAAHDFAELVRTRAAASGVRVDPDAFAERPGVARGQTAPEAVGADQGRRLVRALDAAAGADGLQLWFFLDHPQVVFGDAIRAAFDGFVDELLRATNLRIVIAGYESVGIPGHHFGTPVEPAIPGQPGLVKEYFVGLRQSDVTQFLSDVAADRNGVLQPQLEAFLGHLTLKHLPQRNSFYDVLHAGRMTRRLRPLVRDLIAETFGQ